MCLTFVRRIMFNDDDCGTCSLGIVFLVKYDVFVS